MVNISSKQAAAGKMQQSIRDLMQCSCYAEQPAINRWRPLIHYGTNY
jgi:hypothetical protein